MRALLVVSAILVILSALNQRPLRWLVWLWVIVVSFPFLVIVGLGFALETGWNASVRGIRALPAVFDHRRSGNRPTSQEV